MWLLDKMLAGYVKRGELTVVTHDGKTYRYGAPDPEFRPVTVRFAVAGVPGRIARDPGLGAAEAYMDGALVVEEGDILDLVNIIRGSHKWEDSAGSNKFLRKGTKLGNLFAQFNWRERSQRNVAPHYYVGNHFLRPFLGPDLQYSRGYFRDLDNSLEQAQLDKKSH